MCRCYLIKVILLFYYLHVFSVQPVLDTEFDLSELKEQNDVNVSKVNGENGIINPLLFGTVKKYYCKVDTKKEPDFLLFGAKYWTFPAQDVSITLEYPSKTLKNNKLFRLGHILTEFKVVFFLDGNESRGFIADGGMLQNHIKLMFSFKNISSLSYQFYLYGIPGRLRNHTENTSFYPLCK